MYFFVFKDGSMLISEMPQKWALMQAVLVFNDKFDIIKRRS